jgi:hypothetical protein
MSIHYTYRRIKHYLYNELYFVKIKHIGKDKTIIVK